MKKLFLKSFVNKHQVHEKAGHKHVDEFDGRPQAILKDTIFAKLNCIYLKAYLQARFCIKLAHFRE
jgi:hypothetical protein